MAQHVLDVPEEGVQGRQQDPQGQREHELDDRDQGQAEQPDADPIQVEQVDDGEGDQPEEEAHRPGHDGRGRQDDLGELDLADQGSAAP